MYKWLIFAYLFDAGGCRWPDVLANSSCIAVSACNSLAAMPATTFPKSYKEMLLLSQYARPASVSTCNKYTWRQIAQDKVAVLPGI
jgi:hypothetical protein